MVMKLSNPNLVFNPLPVNLHKAISSPSSEVPDMRPMPNFSGFWAMLNRFCRFWFNAIKL